MSAFISRKNIIDKKWWGRKRNLGKKVVQTSTFWDIIEGRTFCDNSEKNTLIFLAGWTAIMLEWNSSEVGIVWGCRLGLEGHRLGLHLMALASVGKQGVPALLAWASIFSPHKLDTTWHLCLDTQGHRNIATTVLQGKTRDFKRFPTCLIFLPNPCKVSMQYEESC